MQKKNVLFHKIHGRSSKIFISLALVCLVLYGVDYFAGYHSRNRAVFTVEWSTGKANFGKILDVSDDTSAASHPWTAMVTKPFLFLLMVGSIINL